MYPGSGGGPLSVNLLARALGVRTEGAAPDPSFDPPSRVLTVAVPTGGFLLPSRSPLSPNEDWKSPPLPESLEIVGKLISLKP